MGACAIEMHLEISQDPLYTEIYEKNASARFEPKTQTHTLCEPAQSKCTSTFTGKMPRPKPAAHTLCEPAQSKCTSRCHKSHFIQGKMPGPSMTQYEHTDQAPAFTPSVRMDTLFGE